MRMAETGFIGWIPEIRNLIISISPGHLMGGAKDNQKYRKILLFVRKIFLHRRNITFREVAIGQPDLLSIYHFRFEITGANKNATASQC